MNEDPNDRRGPAMESPLGRVSIGEAEARRSIVIEDPTDSVSSKEQIVQNEREVMEEVHRVRAEDTRMEIGAKRRTEILTNLGRATDDVEFDNVTFSIRTLKSYEWRESIKAVAKFDLAHEQALEMRGQVLGRSIYAIDNQPVDLVLGFDELDKVIVFINEMDEAFVGHLYDKYNKLVENNKSKYSLSTNEGMEEAAEQIKK